MLGVDDSRLAKVSGFTFGDTYYRPQRELVLFLYDRVDVRPCGTQSSGLPQDVAIE